MIARDFLYFLESSASFSLEIKAFLSRSIVSSGVAFLHLRFSSRRYSRVKPGNTLRSWLSGVMANNSRCRFVSCFIVLSPFGGCFLRFI